MIYTVTFTDEMGQKEPKVMTVEHRSMTKNMLSRIFCKKTMQDVSKWLLFGTANFEMTDADGNKVAWGKLSGSCFSGWNYNVECDKRYVA